MDAKTSVSTALRQTECSWEMLPLCPYCGKSYHHFSLAERSEGEMDCDHCGKRFRFEAHIIARYETAPIEGWKNVEQPPEPACEIPF